jgi:hypothetical protein
VWSKSRSAATFVKLVPGMNRSDFGGAPGRSPSAAKRKTTPCGGEPDDSMSRAGGVGDLRLMSQWNAFVWPVLMLNTETSYTVPLALGRMIGLTGVDYSRLILDPSLLLVFLFFQKQFIAGLSGGAVNG